jgi:excisionase family DNA binding protein
MTENLSLGEAAIALGVSVDTLRRWDRAGRISTTRD